MGLFKILNTIVKTGSKEIAKNQKLSPGQWKYDMLNTPFKESAKLFQNSNFPILRGSDELWPLVNAAIKTKNKENAMKVIEHIKFHDVGSINSYKIIVRTIKKAFKEIDITDVL